MSALSKEQKDELVTSYAALALYDGDVSQADCFVDGMVGSVEDGCLGWPLQGLMDCEGAL